MPDPGGTRGAVGEKQRSPQTTRLPDGTKLLFFALLLFGFLLFFRTSGTRAAAWEEQRRVAFPSGGRRSGFGKSG